MRYITPLAEVTWEVWNRDNTFDAIYILYDVVPLRFHKGRQDSCPDKLGGRTAMALRIQ